MPQKSTIEEIRERFDHDVERSSNLETGQQATMDAPLVLDLGVPRRYRTRIAFSTWAVAPGISQSKFCNGCRMLIAILLI
jgi:hypothetical protein